MTTFFYYPMREVQDELAYTAKTLVAPGKGIITADEAISTMGKRFDLIGVENTEENRRIYRQLLFTTDAKISESVSGVVMYHESLYQKTDAGLPFPEVLRRKGILPGIKVDKSAVPLFCSVDEYTTQGLDDLHLRIAQYKKDGCEFAKWRTIIKIDKHTPSYQAIMEISNVLARYASICQAQRVVPIVEVDVLNMGDHDLDRCQKVTETVLSSVFKALNNHHVFLEGMLLRPSMVMPGQSSNKNNTAAEIGMATILALRRTVPPAVPGIVFLSGGMCEEEASINLNAVNNVPLCKPWALTFGFSRALQASVLRTWNGKRDNVVAAQNELLKRVRANSLASIGKYVAGSIETSAGFEKNFVFDGLNL